METFEERLGGLLRNSSRAISSRLLNSIANFFLPQIKKAGEARLDYPVLLGTHAIIQTVAERIFGLCGQSGTEFYLRSFVDAGTPDRTYSIIAAEIHELRNAVAHIWLSKLGHTLAFDYTISGGFEKRGAGIHFNPAVYLRDFLAGFQAGGPIWNYRNLTTDNELLIRKYEFIADWLGLPRNDPVRAQIRSLRGASAGARRDAIEEAIQADIKARYSL